MTIEKYRTKLDDLSDEEIFEMAKNCGYMSFSELGAGDSDLG